MSKETIENLQDVQDLQEAQSERLDMMLTESRAISKNIEECLGPFKKSGIISVEDDDFYKPVHKYLAKIKVHTTPEEVLQQIKVDKTNRSLRRVRNIMKKLGWKSKVLYDGETKTNKRVWVCRT